MITGIIIGLFIGLFIGMGVGGWIFAWLIKIMKKYGYIRFDVTKKFKDEFYKMDETYWKEIWNSESENANWEIWHDLDKKTVTLHYVPEEDYSDKDVKIEVPYEQFEDLLKFMIRIS